jgi:V/A-type H+-transporting ATPase subunit E
MSQQVQELINKIKTEGLQAADQKAREIEAEARKESEEIVENAQRRAQHMIAEAETVIKKREESARMALQQSSRDMLLSLRKEIEKILRGIVTAKVGEAMTPERLSHVIREVSQKAVDQDIIDKGIEVVLNAQDFKSLGNGFLAELQKQLKKPLELKSADDIGKGFMISFDQGKSRFDFTDASLADYLSASLNEQVAALLKEAV